MAPRVPGNSRRVGRAREAGMRSVSQITRITIAGSLAITAVVSTVAARGFAGRSRTSTDHAGTSLASASSGSSGQRVALPPSNGGALSAPAAPPVSQPVPAPAVTSGGS